MFKNENSYLLDLDFGGGFPNANNISKEILLAIDDYIKTNPNSLLSKHVTNIKIKTFNEIVSKKLK